MNVKELKEVVKKHGLRGYSRLRKAELEQLVGIGDAMAIFGEAIKKFLQKEESANKIGRAVDNLFCNECKSSDIMVVKFDRWCAECGCSDLRVKTLEMKAKEECSALHKKAQESGDPLDLVIYSYQMGLAYKRLVDRRVKRSRSTSV